MRQRLLRAGIGALILITTFLAGAIARPNIVYTTLAAIAPDLSACDVVYPDTQNVQTPDPRLICKYGIFVEVGTACPADTTQAVEGMFRKDNPNLRLKSINRIVEGDGKSAFAIAVAEPQYIKLPPGVIEMNGKFHKHEQRPWVEFGFTWRCKTPTAMGVIISDVPTGPTAPSFKCYTVSELDKQFGIIRDAPGAMNGLLYDKQQIAGAVIKVNTAQQNQLKIEGWTLLGDNPDVKSAWSPEGCRPLKP